MVSPLVLTFLPSHLGYFNLFFTDLLPPVYDSLTIIYNIVQLIFPKSVL